MKGIEKVIQREWFYDSLNDDIVADYLAQLSAMESSVDSKVALIFSLLNYSAETFVNLTEEQIDAIHFFSEVVIKHESDN